MVRLIGELDSKSVVIKAVSNTDSALLIKDTSDVERFKITSNGKLQTSFDVNENRIFDVEVLNFNSTSEPVSPTIGDVYFDDTEKTIKFYDGDDWESVSTTDGDITGVEAGTGLTGGGSSGDVTLNVGQGDGILLSATTVGIALSTTSGLALEGSSPNKTLEIDNSIAGNGLNITDKVLSISSSNGSLTVTATDVDVTFAGTGSADTSARSDHTHTEYVLKAGDTMSGNLLMGSNKVESSFTPAGANDLTNKAYVDSLVTGLSWRDPVDEVSLSPTGDEIGNDGWRVLINGTGSGAFSGEDNKIAVWDDTEEEWSFITPEDGWALFDRDTDAGYNFSGSVWVQFTGAGSINAGIGLEKDGNTLNVLLGAGITQLPTDEVGIHLSSTSGLELTAQTSVGTLQVADTIAGNGLGITSKILSVGEGTGISVDSTTVSIDLTANLTWTGNHNFTGNFSLDGTQVTSTASELNKLSGTSANVTASNLNTLTAGSSSDADALHTHNGLANQYTQSVTAQTNVNVNHNLGKYPLVQAIDNSGYWVLPGNIQHTSVNAFSVTFAESFTGTIIYIG